MSFNVWNVYSFKLVGCVFLPWTYHLTASELFNRFKNFKLRCTVHAQALLSVTRIANELFQVKELQRLQDVVQRMKCILLQTCRLCVFVNVSPHCCQNYSTDFLNCAVLRPYVSPHCFRTIQFNRFKNFKLRCTVHAQALLSVTRIANELFQVKELQRLQDVVQRMKCILLQTCRLCVLAMNVSPHCFRTIQPI